MSARPIRDVTSRASPNTIDLVVLSFERLM